ncbi:hypothetical protein K491DRAFT_685363 [Lophiostoma macrostomum CBS 122681]|uniref:Uncharacterized protein n=1 Tax=Lophiostoma macrostomum CBS 122681 TaxID=1314788 RepID=A0A6A6SIQ8_9PLEO|nr:hypothetical protein K491DRAFT_685363 [Lophiostoma macrostomum CBS 122681]
MCCLLATEHTGGRQSPSVDALRAALPHLLKRSPPPRTARCQRGSGVNTLSRDHPKQAKWESRSPGARCEEQQQMFEKRGAFWGLLLIPPAGTLQEADYRTAATLHGVCSVLSMCATPGPRLLCGCTGGETAHVAARLAGPGRLRWHCVERTVSVRRGLWRRRAHG